MMKTKRWRKRAAAVFLALASAGLAGGLAGEAAGETSYQSEAFQQAAAETVSPQVLSGEGETAATETKTETPVQQRDPFAATAEMARQAASGSAGSGQGGSGVTFTASSTLDKMPKMKLKGHLQGPDGEPVALLEIGGGGVHIVREGDTVGLHDLGYNSVIQIKEISRLHLVIESGSLGQLIIVR